MTVSREVVSRISVSMGHEAVMIQPASITSLRALPPKPGSSLFAKTKTPRPSVWQTRLESLHASLHLLFKPTRCLFPDTLRLGEQDDTISSSLATRSDLKRDS